MVFVNSQGPLPYTDFAFPDTCNTPVGPAIVPLPYPSFGLGPTAVPSQMKVLAMCMPAHNMATVKPITNGDNTGVALGLLSGMVMGPGASMAGSTVLLVGGPPATKMAMPTKQNGVGPNAFGMTLSPSQVKLMALR